MSRRLAPLVALALALGACGSGGGPGEVLFGRPGPGTGLDSGECLPEIEGDDPWVPPDYGPRVIERLRDRTPLDPPGPLPGDPYLDPGLVPAETGGVCAVLPVDDDPDAYRLRTFPEAAAAAAAGGVVTHVGACGACSTLQDLAVYLETPDLGGPVRECALLQITRGPEATLACITELGFSEACAQIWAFNSANTRRACLEPCLGALEEPGHLPDGSLNPCLACDEEQSGPVFKAVAGRTRRSSGIPSAICRPPGEVARLRHDAYP